MHELRTLADARALRDELVPGASLVVIGGGFVGAEVASTALGLGLRVTIVEAAPAPVARVLGDEVGLLLAERWRAHGVDVRLGTGVAHDPRGCRDASTRSCSPTAACSALTPFSSASASSRSASSCRSGRRRRAAVRRRRRSRPLDGCGARRDAAARRILGLPLPPPQPHYVWSDQFGLRLQVVGSPRPDDPFELDGDGDSFAVRYLDANGTHRAGLLANRPLEAAALRRGSRRPIPLAA